MLSEEEHDEVRSLRERIYGRNGDGAADAALTSRLAELEHRSATYDEVEVSSVQDRALSREVGNHAAILDRPARPRRAVVQGGGVLILAAFAFSGGLVMGQLLPRAGFHESYPELGWAQTEDALDPVPGLPDPYMGMDPASARYIGKVRGAGLYLGHAAGSGGICIAARTPDPQQSTASCGDAAIVAQMGEDFVVSVGEPEDSLLREFTGGLTPHQLSESVTAYLAD
ncbi:hypothetical protein Q9R20_06240 [Microbacterium sp. PRF11]|uniref:hypothetical protein n=1 Tax=Microbacterium sp. PRF11 TaxID=2962593 RepID=UPI00288292B6|nr:hypothetical protein [Microbacterium sp. PRF11]MDT0116586.1 hypothetical protein [Microbacterium sp. PRF11]